MNVVSNNGKVCSSLAYSRSFPIECQLGGRLMEGRGPAGQRTASSPGAVPMIPVESYERLPRFAILMWRHIQSDHRNDLYQSFKNINQLIRKNGWKGNPH